MTSDARLRLALARVRRRALFDSALRWGWRAVATAGLWLALVGAGGRWVPGLRIPAVLLAGVALCLLAAAAGWVGTRPSLSLVSRTADARLALDERLGTALGVLDRAHDPLEAALVADAAASAARVELGRAYPLGRHRRGGLAAAGAVAAATVVLALPAASTTVIASPRSQADAAAQRSASDAVAKQQQAAAQAAAKDPASQRLKQLEQVLADARRDLERSTSPRQSLERLSQLSDQLQALADPNAQSVAAAAQAAGDALRSDPSTAAIARDLARGENATAAADLQALAAGLDGLSPAQRASAGSALSRAGQAAMADAGLSGALAGAGSALQRGDIAGARSGLARAAGRTADIGKAVSTSQQIAAAEAAIENAREAAAAQADRNSSGQGSPAQGHGQGQGQGQSGGGQGGQGGLGRSGSGGANSQPAPGSDQIFVAGQPGDPAADDSIPPPLAPGRPVPLTDLVQVIAAFQRSALDSLDRSVVSPSDRDLVHAYFSSLGAGS